MDIKVGDRVAWIGTQHGLRNRKQGIVRAVSVNNFTVYVDRVTPLTDTGERLGPDCVYRPARRYTPKKSWCCKYKDQSA